MNLTTFVAALTGEEKTELLSILQDGVKGLYGPLTQEESRMDLISAIKAYRIRTNVDLRTAKDIVEEARRRK